MNQLVTFDNFNEHKYLESNLDVLKAVENKIISSGCQHFKIYGYKEKRLYRNPQSFISEAKRVKMNLIKPLIREDLPYKKNELYYDFLSDSVKKDFNIHNNDAISSHDYSPIILSLIENYKDGIILDVGAGKRPTYYSNVVNLEIFPYDTTDVLSIGEILPFHDNSFDAVISVAVLEHVKDPFSCAKEIARVLKPGGKLFCSVPFLQPVHAYPNHYYNMTSQGLKNLFEDVLIIDKIEVCDSLLPIWTLTWFLKSWVDGLHGITKEKFLQLQIKDLIGDPSSYLNEDYVRSLSREKNDELASGNAIFAHKKIDLIKRYTDNVANLL